MVFGLDGFWVATIVFALTYLRPGLAREINPRRRLDRDRSGGRTRHLAETTRSAYFFYYIKEKGAIGRARRDGTIAFHCGISGALLVHFLRRFDPR